MDGLGGKSANAGECQVGRLSGRGAGQGRSEEGAAAALELFQGRAVRVHRATSPEEGTSVFHLEKCQGE